MNSASVWPTVAAVLPFDRMSASSRSRPHSATMIQSTTLTLSAGTYYILAVSDATNAVSEAKETSNLKKAQKTLP